MIKEPTRVTANSSTCTDNAFTDLQEYKIKVIKTTKSDHYAQMLTILDNGYNEDIRMHETKKRAFTKQNTDHL